MTKNGKELVYKPKALIPGYKIEQGLSGYYAAVPNKAYSKKPFKINYVYSTDNDGKLVFVEMSREVKNWNKAEHFRRFPDKWGRGIYTLGYFKMCEQL